MEAVRAVLAVAGVLAALWGTLRAALALARRAAEAYLARELARTRARHGDVTGLSELRAAHGHARRARTVAVLRVALWSAILVAPAFTPWPLTLYAASSLGWVLHWRRDRHR